MLLVTTLDDILGLIGVAGPASSFESEELDFKRPGRDVRHTLELLADAAVCFADARAGPWSWGSMTKRRPDPKRSSG